DATFESAAIGVNNQLNASTHNLKITFNVKIRNLGNTPALFISGREVLNLPDGWTWTNGYPEPLLIYDLTEPELPSNIGPKEETPWSRALFVSLTDEAFERHL